VIVFMNGCDTFAYVDGALAQTRAAINPDDPSGTRYLEFITNGMPTYFADMAGSTLSLVKGLLRWDAPQTYEKMFAGVASAQVVNVTGEEDNLYTPGYIGFATVRADVDPDEELQFQTPDLPPGKYVVQMGHDASFPGGDADLFVKVGGQPTRDVQDCAPYTSSSDESCNVTLSARGRIFISVFGYAAPLSHFVLTARAELQPAWAGIDQSSVTLIKDQERRWQTPQLGAGSYVFETSGSGDVDLYVKTGTAPTTTSYECRPYTGGSNERCVVKLTAPAVIHAMVRGYATTSTVRFVARVE